MVYGGMYGILYKIRTASLQQQVQLLWTCTIQPKNGTLQPHNYTINKTAKLMRDFAAQIVSGPLSCSVPYF